MITLNLEIKFKEITHLLSRTKIHKPITIDPKVIHNIEQMTLFQILKLNMNPHNQPNQIALLSNLKTIQQVLLTSAILNLKHNIRIPLQIITIQTQIL